MDEDPALTRDSLVAGLGRIATAMVACADQLNSADARFGDGDLGVTMHRGTSSVVEILPELSADVGQALVQCARAFTRVSGSSFGTLLATGLMSAAKICKGRNSVPWAEFNELLGAALTAMMARGKGALGDKTVLDALDAVCQSSAGVDDPQRLLAVSREAVREALDRYRQQPAKIGRARMFGDQTIGFDDPGMLALRDMLEALAGPAQADAAS